MKSYLILVTGAVLALSACTQVSPYGTTDHSTLPKENPAHRQYLALPGQGAVNTHATNTDAAFEEQVAAYTGQTVPTPAVQPTPVVNQPYVQQQMTGYQQTYAEPQVPGYPQPMVPGAGVDPMYPQQGMQAGVTNYYPSQPAADGSAGYAVQVSNATNGRIFIEMHDDSDNIFPVASMYAGQKISTQPQEPRPISGQLTVVVRDPDQPGAPELRRYKVNPPPAYMGKTIGITILSGGRYRASLDGEVYYATPEPTTKPAEKKAEKKEEPATPAKPAATTPATAAL